MSIKGKFLRRTKEDIKRTLKGTGTEETIKEKKISSKKKVRFTERMEVRSVMKEPIKIKENMPIRDFLGLRKETEKTCFIVVDDKERLKGILTDSDLLKIVRKPRKKTGIGGIGYKSLLFRGAETVGGIMTKNPIYVKPKCKLEDATSIMRDYKIRHLPVVEDNKLIGAIGLRDVVLLLRILI